LHAYDSRSHRIQCSAIRLAPAARDWLATNTLSRPYQIFESVCNLIDAAGDVLSIMLVPAEMNPLALEIDLSHDLRQYVKPQSEVRLEGNYLHAGIIAIQLASQKLWDPSPNWHAARVNQSNVRSLVGEVASPLIDDHAPESLAVFLRSPESLESPVEGWQKRAQGPINRLMDGLEAGDTTSAVAGAADLAGLGMGLTPSGDDFIIGVMHALWCTSPLQEASTFCTALLNAITPRTNRLSASYLARSACGEAGEAWHLLIQAMAQGDARALSAPVKSLIGLGHTSGQDALSGFVLSMRQLLGPRDTSNTHP
jgi:hypothetical protein